jgi:hypothetical protein
MNKLEFTKVEMGDHEFAAWLRNIDPDWRYEKIDERCTKFLDRPGNVLAIVFYDNANSTHEIHVSDKFNK